MMNKDIYLHWSLGAEATRSFHPFTTILTSFLDPWNMFDQDSNHSPAFSVLQIQTYRWSAARLFTNYKLEELVARLDSDSMIQMEEMPKYRWAR